MSDRSRKSEASVWETAYNTAELKWRSAGLTQAARELLCAHEPPSRLLLEIGSGLGDDAEGLVELGFRYLGIDLSHTAVRRAQEARVHGASFEVRDFFGMRARERFGVVYDKGVFHGLPGVRRRKTFVRHVANALKPGGLWLTICGVADAPVICPRGAVLLQHIIEAVESDFVPLILLRSPYCLREAQLDFPSWHCLFRVR